MKQAVILGFLGQTRDRFSEYQTPRSTQEKLAMAQEIPGIDGIEMVHPYETGDPDETRRWVEQAGLSWAAVNVNVKKDPRFVSGALTRSDRSIGAAALDFIKKGKDFAEAVGAPRVTCCPLSDGYDYLFQVDYAQAWRTLREIMEKAAAYKPHIPLCLEYKPSETRVRCTLDSAAKTLLLCKEIGNPALGVTIDFGHSIYGNENPAEALCMLAESGHPYYIHLNDNDGRFDWDLIGGTYHFWHYVEFLYYARKYRYDGHFTTDMSPRVLDIKQAFAHHADVTRKVWDKIADLDDELVGKLIAEEQPVELMKHLHAKIMGV